MKIAIIGSGISGLFACWALNKQHQVTLFEKDTRLGGHTATHEFEFAGKQYAIDTGFIVFNDWTYPNFNRFIDHLGVTAEDTEMSFSVKNSETGLEYNGHNLNTLFAQRRQLASPKFYHFLYEITRFNKTGKSLLANQDPDLNLSLGDFLKKYRFSDYFARNYILAMGAAIWSSGLTAMQAFPLHFFMRFFNNHGLLNISERPQWKVIKGGSQRYIDAMRPAIEKNVRLNSHILSVKREQNQVVLQFSDHQQSYDQVIFACHSDQALSLLADPSVSEQAILSALPYQKNQVILHTDTALLPQRKRAWAAWNYALTAADPDFPTLTYNMNILQNIKSEHTFCVTLNQTAQIKTESILAKFEYAHPVYSNESILAQQKRNQINGLNNTWYAGAYWYNGFHEDGLTSALDIVRAMGIEPL
ncbi:NAD(P)/FAD-dependent oxidoreductase [Gayadomonas joobiniege]|uniref:NAD(P)/FAD-dependent oxidoreductase n=1 Tax=Gayadomonas joobiniege TaxID=1234606 RepID=UPI000373A5CD|nr:FAD-dependent oxidoreductase [Gayadomonas joobiniege]